MTLGRPQLREILATADPADHRPITVRRGEVTRRDGVDIERIELLESDRLIPALLMTTTPPPWPAAVIAIHQHNGQFAVGKSEVAGLAGNPQMAYGLRMAATGIAVIAPDLSGFEERMPSDGDPAMSEQRTAWELVASERTLQGRHSDDVSLAVTWLTEQAGVTGAVGVIGHSLGAQVALFTMAVDPRIRAGVISCGAGTLSSFAEAGIFHNPAYYVPTLATAGDLPAVVRCLDNQPVFLLAGTDDPLFPASGVDAVVAALDPSCASVVRFDGGHEFPLAIQQSAIEWLAETLTQPASGVTCLDTERTK